MSKAVLSQQFIQKAIGNSLQNQTCAQLHPGVSCNLKMVHQFTATCQSLYKTYLLVHLIPFIIFKRKKIMHRPWREIKNLIKGFIKSMMFVGFYMVIVRRTICEMTKYYKFSSLNATVGGFLGGVALMLETKGRQAEIALYCVNKSIETVYSLLRRRNYPVRIPYGECLLVGVATGIICYLYSDCNKAFQSKYAKVLDRIIGSI